MSGASESNASKILAKTVTLCPVITDEVTPTVATTASQFRAALSAAVTIATTLN